MNLFGWINDLLLTHCYNSYTDRAYCGWEPQPRDPTNKTAKLSHPRFVILARASCLECQAQAAAAVLKLYSRIEDPA